MEGDLFGLFCARNRKKEGFARLRCVVQGPETEKLKPRMQLGGGAKVFEALV